MLDNIPQCVRDTGAAVDFAEFCQFFSSSAHQCTSLTALKAIMKALTLEN